MPRMKLSTQKRSKLMRKELKKACSRRLREERAVMAELRPLFRNKLRIKLKRSKRLKLFKSPNKPLNTELWLTLQLLNLNHKSYQLMSSRLLLPKSVKSNKRSRSLKKSLQSRRKPLRVISILQTSLTSNPKPL